MPTAAHFIYIPGVLILGVVIGWILGSRAAADAYAAQFEDDFKNAVEFFFGKDAEIAEDEREQEFHFHTALDYFVYDYRLPDNDQRVIERFIATNEKHLSPQFTTVHFLS